MSDIKIISQSQLNEFLKIVAQESLIKSKSMLKENIDQGLSDYSTKFKSDEKKYGNLVAEAEHEEDEEEEELIQDTEVETPPDQQEDPISSEYEDLENVSFERIKDAINRVRSGRSLKDKQIKDSLQRYFEKLDEDERVVFYLFLEELSKIITGAISGKDAQDPGDDPLNIDFVTPDEKADNTAQAAVSVDDTEEEDIEDTSPPDDDEDAPPIAVNEAQRKKNLREKVRKLMS